MPIAVTEAQLAEVRRLLALHAPHARVVAYGSRVTGKARKHSDLDLAVFVPGGLPLRLWGRLREAFQESDLPFSVDVSDGARLPAWLAAEVDRVGVEVQAAGESPLRA